MIKVGSMEVSFEYDGAYCVDTSMNELMEKVKQGWQFDEASRMVGMAGYCSKIDLTLETLGWNDVIVGYRPMLMKGHYENFCYGGKIYVKVCDHRMMVCVYRMIVKELRYCAVM